MGKRRDGGDPARVSCVFGSADSEKGKEIAESLGIPYSSVCPPRDGEGLYLVLDGEGLALTDGVMVLRGDFRELLPRVRGHSLNGELLVRASSVKKMSDAARSGQGGGSPSRPPYPRAVDAAAGMGEDGFLLAAAGFRVVLCERDPVIAWLLEDALARAAEIPELASAAERMELYRGDSRAFLRDAGEAPDLIYLDPMFPPQKRGGLTGKKLQMLRRLEAPCGEEEELFGASAAAGPRRIVVKRPVKGPFLAGKKPGYSIAGKTVRYDVYVFGTRA